MIKYFISCATMQMNYGSYGCGPETLRFAPAHTLKPKPWAMPNDNLFSLPCGPGYQFTYVWQLIHLICSRIKLQCSNKEYVNHWLLLLVLVVSKMRSIREMITRGFSSTNRCRRLRRISSLAGSDANFSPPACEPATDLALGCVVSWLARSVACRPGTCCH